MRYRVAVVLGYLAIMTGWTYGVTDGGHRVPETIGAVVLIVSQLVLGLLVGRWWALLLPGAVPLIAIPAGYSDAYPSTEIPIWFGAMIGALFAVPLVVIGVLIRRVVDSRMARRATGGSLGARGSVLPSPSRR